MRYALLLVIMLWPASALADVRFSHSVGLGPQYGGLLGWQGRVSGERLHGRVGLGFGVSAGVDVAVNERILLGVTHTQAILFSMTGLGLTYVPGGDYTAGWRFGLEAGPGKVETLFKVEEEASLKFGVSMGYAF